MSSGTLASPSSNNSLGIWLLPVLAIALGASIVGGGLYALAGLAALLFFGVFVRYPVLGMYATVAMLILQGSSGVLGKVEEGAFFVTIAQLAGAAAMGAWLLNVTFSRTPVRYNGAVLALTAFMVWSLAGVILAAEMSDQFPQWVRMFTRFALFILAVNTLNTSKNMHWYVIVILVSGFIMALSAVAQYVMPSLQVEDTAQAIAGVSGSGADGAYVDQESLTGEAAVRVSGRVGHSNWLALFILLVLPLNIYWFTVSRSTMVKTFVVLAMAVQVVALILTFTRSGLVIGAVLVFLMLARRTVNVSPLRFFGFLFALVIAWTLLPQAYKERVLSPKQYTQSRSVESRMDLQAAALEYAAKNPILGLGSGGFGIEFVRERNETAGMMKLMVDHMNWQPIFIGTHNMYLQLAAESGMVGFTFFAIFYVYMLRELLRKEKRFKEEGDTRGQALASALIVSLIGFMLCGVFLHALHQVIWWMVAAAAVALPLHDLKFTPQIEGKK
jgi:O-antigen ligase